MFKALFFTTISLIIMSSGCKTSKSRGTIIQPLVIDFLSDDYFPTMIKRGGEAPYELEEGILTGSAIMNSPNTFLCTQEAFGDFILDFEVKIDPRLNSGVQIRSEVIQDENNDALRGYQVEIDPSARAWSGGIYEERDRGWIANLSANPEGKKAFQNGKWNKYHIETKDSSIRVWVNGINTANLLDNKTKKGIIGLQVHSIGDSSLIGTQVQWRNIKLYNLPFQDRIVPVTSQTPEINLLPNQLSQKEIAKGWVLKQPQKPCITNNNPLEILSTNNDFEIAFEYTISKGGRAALSYGQSSEAQDLLSYTLLDEFNAPEDSRPTTKAGALEDRIAAVNLSTEGRHKGVRSHNQWSQVHLKYQNNKVEHWLNNDKVVSYNLNEIDGLDPINNIILKTATDSICVRSIKYLTL